MPVSPYWKWKPEEGHAPMPDEGVCFDCGARIIWAYDENARPQPLDPEQIKVVVVTTVAGEQYGEVVTGHRLHRQACEERQRQIREQRSSKKKLAGE